MSRTKDRQALLDLCAIAMGINKEMQRYAHTQDQKDRLADAMEAIEEIAGEPIIPSCFGH